jgi:tripartite motif-containing protein 71
MTNQNFNDIDPDEYDLVEVIDDSEENEPLDEGKRRFLLFLQLFLIGAILIVGFLSIRYLISPAPISEIIPLIELRPNTPPTYKFSMNLDAPLAVAVSPDNQRIYAIEGSGDRLIKMFDRDGQYLTSFSPPYTNKSNRKYGFIAVGNDGRVFVSDTYNDVITIFDKDGNFIDGIIGKDITLSKVINGKIGRKLLPSTIMYYDLINHTLIYQEGGKPKQTIPEYFIQSWSPLGVRVSLDGSLLVTNILAGKHEILVYPAEMINSDLSNFNSPSLEFGIEGTGSGQLSFPNSVVKSSLGDYYVSDGNNARISVWSSEGKYKSFFGFGATEGTLNLPRGIWMDNIDRLHVADSVGQQIRVYDVASEQPSFSFNIGDFGSEDGMFNYPGDIIIDGTSRLYVADRKNNRVQVWSY